MYNQIFFTNILRLIDEQGVTKTELADRAGMSISFLSDITNGIGNPSLEIMESISEALGVPLPALLEMTDLDKDTLDVLAGGKAPRYLPDGLERVTAILNEYQAFTVRRWDAINKQLFLKKKTKKSQNR
jgi:transcriptional regulator with XRE-family HTH domain